MFTILSKMKKATLFLLLAFTAFAPVFAPVFAQTTRIVCNASGYNNGVNNTTNAANKLVYDNLQTCLDASTAGDIIYVQGSGVSYGNIAIKKSVVLIGPGYFIGQNGTPNTQALTATATLGNVEVESTASNSIIKGFVTGYIAVRDASQIIVQNNYSTGSIHLKNSNNCIIKQNFGTNIVSWSGEWTNNAGVIVQNNIFSGGSSIQNGTVTNNIFDSDSNGDFYFLSGCTIKNNIFGTGNNGLPYIDRIHTWYSGYTYSSGFVNSTVSYNVFQQMPIGGSNTNTYNADINSLFIGYPTQGGNSTDGRYQLKQDSPAIGAGEGGTDCGAFGGTEPYKLSGIGFNPNIFKVEMPTTGTSQGGLPVKVLISANQ